MHEQSIKLEAEEQGYFSALELQPADGLLALIGEFRSDSRRDKIDLGVGVYRDERGRTPVLRSVKEAERRLFERQPTKAYVGPEGDVGFTEALKPIIFGEHRFDGRVAAIQTPGGTGALRTAAELAARARPGGRIWLGAPSWPNHLPILRASGLSISEYQHFDIGSQELSFDKLLEALLKAERGDLLLLHGSCHNPTGADLDIDQWSVLANVLRDRGILPLIDFAYQGLGDGIDEDAAGVRLMLNVVGEGLVAYSCDKNFGLYRERVGALYALAPSPRGAATIQSNLLSLTRANWSMPPDHGAAVVRLILEDARLRSEWMAELGDMRQRIQRLRTMLAGAVPWLAPLGRQQGMFSTLPLTPSQVARLRAEHGIYMPSSGRINIAGLATTTISTFADAVASVR